MKTGALRNRHSLLKIIGTNIQIRREQRGLSAVQLAKLAGVPSYGQIRNIEKGAHLPSIPRLEMIARALECSPVDLVPREDQWKPIMRAHATPGELFAREIWESARTLSENDRQIILSVASSLLHDHMPFTDFIAV